MYTFLHLITTALLLASAAFSVAIATTVDSDLASADIGNANIITTPSAAAATTPKTVDTNKDSSNKKTRKPPEADEPLLEYIKAYNVMLRNLSQNEEAQGHYQEKPELEIDQAWLTINSSVSYVIEIWAQTSECYKCDLMYITSVKGNSVFTLLVNATYITDIRLVRVHPEGTTDQLCSFEEAFIQDGDYWTFIDYPKPNEQIKCPLILANDPDAAELPILYVFLTLVGLAILYVVGKRVILYCRNATASKRDSMDVTSHDQEGGDAMRMDNGSAKVDVGEKPEAEEPVKKVRLRSLDTFRGLSLTLMIFVNYGGGHYWFFEHAPWNGIYVADLVFPWFVFIMGVSMNFSFKSMFRKSWSVPRITWKIVWRSAKLFAFGFMLGTHHWVADLPNVRVLGVLQRLALTYLISSLVHFCCARRFDSHQDRKWAPVRDIILYLPEWLVNLGILAVHLGLIYGLPVPGCPTGYVGPGGLSEGGKYQNCTGGATQYIDTLLLGTEHMYKYPTPQVIYQTTVAFDPEGFLGTLNCVFLCFLGIQCGRIILIFQTHKERIIRFLVWAVALGALAALLTKCSQDEGWIPPNKNIWSLSYSLITASFGFILLLGLYVLTDVVRIWEGQPFSYPGMNSIVIYCAHSIFYKMFPVNWVVEEDHLSLLMRCVWGTAVWAIVAYWLYLKEIFIAL